MKRFQSRRSPVFSLNGVVAASQPLAVQAGVRILQKGGNAADAAVAVAAMLNVTEPCSTGIGGDAFCLFYNAETKEVRGINGSGRSGAALTRELVLEKLRLGEDPGPGARIPSSSGLSVTVPGAAACWADTLAEFGTKTLADVLQPAIENAERGVPVHTVAACHWGAGADKLRDEHNPHGGDLLMAAAPGGKRTSAPQAGQVMKMPNLARTFRELAEHGKAGFYTGRIAKAVADCVAAHGGVLTTHDLEQHTSTVIQPIHVNYKGVDVWECPPNGQGLVALMALNMLKTVPDIAAMGHNSPQYLHTLIDTFRLSFADGQYFVADPEHVPAKLEELLSQEYGKKRAALLDPKQRLPAVEHGDPELSSDTVYFCVVDGQGNACSFINSNYEGFGTGFVPEGCGFTLQNRGSNFSLEKGHPNQVNPGKRPYHTIIPGMATKDGELWAAFGVMGGFMQPQGHVQTLLNMIEFGMDPQEALDAPRVCLGDHVSPCNGVLLEEGISDETLQALRAMGHPAEGPVTEATRARFGRGQIIRQLTSTDSDGNPVRVFVAGSDPRADGMAVGL